MSKTTIPLLITLVTIFQTALAQSTAINGYLTGYEACPIANGVFCNGEPNVTPIGWICTNWQKTILDCRVLLKYIPPYGNKDDANCYQSSWTAGDGVCVLNGTAYYPRSSPPSHTSSSSTSTSTSSLPATTSSSSSTASSADTDNPGTGVSSLGSGSSCTYWTTLTLYPQGYAETHRFVRPCSTSSTAASSNTPSESSAAGASITHAGSWKSVDGAPTALGRAQATGSGSTSMGTGRFAGPVSTGMSMAGIVPSNGAKKEANANGGSILVSSGVGVVVVLLFLVFR